MKQEQQELVVTSEAKPGKLVPVAANTGSTPTDLLRLAVEGNVDVDKLERLMQLERDWRADQARKAFYDAMAQFQSECPAIPQAKAVPSRSGGVMYRYAPLDTILTRIRATEAKHGFRHSWNQEDSDGGGVRITCTISHREGHSESSSVTIPPTKGMNTNAAQDRGIEISYGQRRSLLNAYGLAVGGEDTDCNAGEPPKPVSKAEIKALRDVLKARNRTDAQLLKYINEGEAVPVETLEDLTRAQYADAMNAMGGGK